MKINFFKNPNLAKAIRKTSDAFTLIELIVVIGIIGILAAAILVALDPIEQFAKTRDTAKQTAAREIVNAMHRYYATYQIYPWDALPSGAASPGTATANGNTGAGCAAAPAAGIALGAPFTAALTGPTRNYVGGNPPTTGTPNNLINGCLMKLIDTGELKSVPVADYLKTAKYLTMGYVGTEVVVCYYPESKAGIKLANQDRIGAVIGTPNYGTTSYFICYK